MGILSFFSKSPEKLEQKGDTCFAGEDFGSAKIEYEKTLEAISKKCPDDSVMKERVLDKLQQSKEALAQMHMENAENLVEADIADEACALFKLAHNLTEKPEMKAALEKKLAALNASFEDNHEEIQEPEAREDAPSRVSESDEFHILCATLPDEMAEAYLSYGDLFVTGYLALSRGDFETAARELKRAMEDHPSADTYIPLEYATALIHLGKNEEAMETLNGFIQAHPESIQGISLLCDLLCESKMFDKAHHLIDSAPDSVKQTLGPFSTRAESIFFRKTTRRLRPSTRIFSAAMNGTTPLPGPFRKPWKPPAKRRRPATCSQEF